MPVLKNRPYSTAKCINQRRAYDRWRARPSLESLEDRIVLNNQWNWNGPPLSVNTTKLSSTLVNVNGSGSASITSKSEIDYFRFTTPSAGFYQLSVSGNFDAMIGLYASGSAGKLLGYADDNASGTESFTVYLEAGKTYFMAITNYMTSKPTGAYTWQVASLGNPIAPEVERVLYVSFDGATLSAANLEAWDNDWTYGTAEDFDPDGDGVTITPFLQSNSQRETIITTILSHLQSDLAPFGVLVVRLAPGSSAVVGQGATTIFVGLSDLEDKEGSDPSRSLFHVACDIDVGNANATDIAFVYDEDWGSVAATSLAMADVILHEAGHTYGMFHVKSGSSLETMGLRYSTPQSNWVKNTSYMNQSFYLREFYGSQDGYQVAALDFGVGAPVPAAISVESFHAEESLLFRGFAAHDHEHEAHEGFERIKVGIAMDEEFLELVAPAIVQDEGAVVTGVDLETPPLLNFTVAAPPYESAVATSAPLGQLGEPQDALAGVPGSLFIEVEDEAADLAAALHAAPIASANPVEPIVEPAAQQGQAPDPGNPAATVWVLPIDSHLGPGACERQANQGLPAAKEAARPEHKEDDADLAAALALFLMMPLHQPPVPAPKEGQPQRRRKDQTECS